MRKIILATVLFLFVFTSVSLAIEGIPIAVHAHVNFADDGWNSPRKTIQYLRLHYKGTIFTPHNDLVMEKGSVADCQKVLESLGDDKFIVIGGMEIAVAKLNPETGKPFSTLCHIGNFGITSPNPYTYDPKKDWNQGWSVAGTLRYEGSISVINHIKDCRDWEQFVTYFDGFELFNDFSIKGEYHRNYVYQRDVYLNSLKSGVRLFVTAGIDLHLLAQAFVGQVTTFVFADCFSRDCILDAIRRGRTVAASNIEKLSLNISPSIETNRLTSEKFKIDGFVKTVQGHAPPKEVIIYKDGVKYGSVPLKSKEALRGFFRDFSFSFEDVAEDSAACYTFEIEEFMVSSPFCFMKEIEGIKSFPKKTFPVVGVKENAYGYLVNKGGVSKPLPDSFEYCFENFLTNSDGFVIGCRDPILVTDTYQGKEAGTIYLPPEWGNKKEKQNLLAKLYRSIAFANAEGEYRCVKNSIPQPSFCTIISSQEIGFGDRFALCDPNQPLKTDATGAVVNCTTVCEGTADLPYANGHPSFVPGSACPKFPSTWLLRN
ncbi:MAG: hypothetical protein PHU42_01940 [Patescibacteria group bacterium]|nr:hypothetical protein [Patescibacteria group bacterium]